MSTNTGRQHFVVLSFLVLFFWGSSLFLQAQLSRPDDPRGERVEDVVSIYLDFPNSSLGRSPYRLMTLDVDLVALKDYRSYPVAEPTGWSTTVYLSAATEEKLRLGKLPISKYIFNRGGIYYLEYQGIQIAFGVEVPSKMVFDIIHNTYAHLPEVEKVVSEHYRSGYTIRIYEAENVLEPGNQLISYPEAILAATFIGDKEQWLWGIHDARDLLNQPLR